MRRNLSIRAYLLVGGLVMVLSLSTLLGVFLYVRHQHQTHLGAYMQQVQLREAVLGRLWQSLGYGGMIQAYKSYAGSGELGYFDAFRHHAEDALNLTYQYDNMKGVTDEEQLALTMLRDTLLLYQQRAGVLRGLWDTHAAARDIEQASRVDDGSAWVALLALHRNVEARQQASARVLLEVPQRALVWVLLVLAVSLLSGVAYLFWLQRRLKPPLRQMAECAQRLAGGERHAVKVPAYTGLAEVEVVAQAFAALTTSLARADQAVQTSQAAQQALLEFAREGIAMMDGEGRILDFNPALARLTAQPRSYLRGMLAHRLIIDRPHCRQTLTLESLMDFAAGSQNRLRWLLRQTEALWKSVLADVPLGVLRVDAQGRIDYANPVAMDWLGLNAERGAMLDAHLAGFAWMQHALLDKTAAPIRRSLQTTNACLSGCHRQPPDVVIRDFLAYSSA